MEFKRLTGVLLMGLLFVQSLFSVTKATPPQMGNPVLRVQRNQIAHALGDSSPKVLAVDTRVLLEGRSPRTVAYRRVANSIGLEAQFEDIARALDAIFRENIELRKRLHELELQLQAFEPDNDHGHPKK